MVAGKRQETVSPKPLAKTSLHFGVSMFDQAMGCWTERGVILKDVIRKTGSIEPRLQCNDQCL